jgi:1-acyl-sn-glycerol-3-phosphate acyltransferase
VASIADIATPADEDHVQRLLDVVRKLVMDVHPGSTAAHAVSLDSILDRELGLDSLSRVELFARVEREFHVDLPESLLAEAQTPGDFLGMILKGVGPVHAPSAEPSLRQDLEAGAAIPVGIQTLPDALAWQAAHRGDRVHIHLYAESETIEPISYRTLYRAAQALAVGLRRSGFKPGHTAALMLPTGREFFCAFAGIQLAGGIPVPIYPPTRLSQLGDHLLRQQGILTNAEAVALITIPDAKQVAHVLQAKVPSIKRVATTSDLHGDPDAFSRPYVAAQDTAFLQYTSGSTGNPKGVVLTHANLLANIRAMSSTLHVTPDDVFVSWLPLYHDMGLIGAWLGALCCGYPLAIMSPLRFLSKPSRWLKAIHRHGGTLSAAPNFAYELCAARISDREIEGLDLSSWRVALNGAEPVSPETIERFTSRFSRYGFRKDAMFPAYGLAESTVGLTFPPPGREPVIDRIKPEPFRSEGLAVPASADEEDALRYVSCGSPLPGHRIRIVDEEGKALPDRKQGHLQFAGPSATAGYHRNPEETAQIKKGEWWDSFDLAYASNGEVFITGRAKDLIIRGGRNLYPYDLELAVGNLPGIRSGCVAVFGSREAHAVAERLIVVAETKERDPAIRDRLRDQITALAIEVVGSPPDDIVLASPHAVLKTSSGKIRRAAMRDRYERGVIGIEPRSGWKQLAQFRSLGLESQARHALHSFARWLFGLYAIGVFATLGTITWLLVAALPAGQTARRVAQTSARALFRACGFRPRVDGLEYVRPDSSQILVSNHASYLDGLLLFAWLPGRPRFIVKGELTRVWVLRTFLEKIGAEFVERFAFDKSVEDAERLARRLQAGESLVFFPEGTLRRPPGLLPFRLGAFSIAVRNQTPLLPLVLRGTRAVLPDGNWLPQYGRLSITICPPLEPEGRDFQAALTLRHAARSSMLRFLDEPDILDPTDTALTRQI